MVGETPPTEVEQHVALEIDKAWLASVIDRAGAALPQKLPANPTIFRVPPSLQHGNRHSYEPKLVSIGPYHRGKPELKAMEQLKWRILNGYLPKLVLSEYTSNNNVDGLSKKMRDLERQARDFYSEVIDLDSNQFMEMLLLDGTFLVHMFITLDDPDEEASRAKELASLLFENMWFDHLLIQDLLLLENQLPYFILEHLINALGMPSWDGSRLQQVIVSYCFSKILPQYSDISRTLPKRGFQVDHLLHLLHKLICSSSRAELENPSGSTARRRNDGGQLFFALSSSINKTVDSLSQLLRCCSPPPSLPRDFPVTVRTMTELAEAGVKFKVREATSFLDILFDKEEGELSIPAIYVGNFTNFILANLITLEQCCLKYGLDVTNYVLFMNDIINTPRDVQLLHEEGIIHRGLGNDDDIASLFNKLGKGVTSYFKSKKLRVVYEDLNAYCQSRWPRWRAKAVRDYFNNPWAIISLGAASLLLVFTALQTVYTVVANYN